MEKELSHYLKNFATTFQKVCVLPHSTLKSYEMINWCCCKALSTRHEWVGNFPERPLDVM